MIKKILLEEWKNLSRLILVIIRLRIISNFFKEENLNFLLVVTRISSFFLFLFCISSLFSFTIIYFRSNLLHFLFLIHLTLQLSLDISYCFLDFVIFHISIHLCCSKKNNAIDVF